MNSKTQVSVDSKGFLGNLFSKQWPLIRPGYWTYWWPYILSMLALISLLLVAQVAMTLSVSVKYTPAALTVVSDRTLPAEKQAQGVETQVTNYAYEGGNYNRLEREFYGYRTLKQTQLDTSAVTAKPYRRITRVFLNDSYYRKGLLDSVTVEDVSGASPLLYTKTNYTYELWNVDTNTGLADVNSTTATVFPRLTRTENSFYEGQPTDTAVAQKTTYTTMGYDVLGNVTTFFDAGDTGTTDDVYASITYTATDTVCVSPYIVGKATGIEVKNSSTSTTLLRKRAATIDCAGGTGNVIEVRQYLDATIYTTTNLAYLANGNLRSITGPTDVNSQRTVMRYEYDAVVNTYPTAIERSYDGTRYYRSTATYDFRYGQALTTTDLNANQIVRSYDGFGRLKDIYGPYEVGGTPPTIAFTYGPVQTIDPATPTTQVIPHYALTKHLDKDADGALKASGTIDTVLIIDGLKRVLQTKKDAGVRLVDETSPIDRMTVSGCITFDAFGRLITQRHPTAEVKGSNTGLNTVCSAANTVTTTAYDVLDRVIQVNTPATATTVFTTAIAYGFGNDRNNLKQFETTVTDAKGKVKKTYKEVRGLIASVRETNLVGTTTEVLWTSYAYDPLKQITAVTDALNNVTAVNYDLLGRRTAISNPDTGPTDYVYDNANNITQKITANLKPANQSIKYSYSYNRLIGINYPNPDALTDDITHTHGAPGAVNNGAGRVVTSTDPSGQTELEYGKLGEVVSEKRTVNTEVTPGTPEEYTTTFNFDTFGRLLRLTYPDGEVLTHKYDSGGNLNQIAGYKRNFTYHYVKDIHYDQFEQRVFSKAGNHVETSYTYDPYNRRLATLNAGKGTLFQKLVYSYDPVNNITQLVNNAALAGPSKFGGPSTQTYSYDDLHRLVSGSGTYQFAANKDDKYSLSMAYNGIHNITAKTQAHDIVITNNDKTTTTLPQKKTSYDWVYVYNASGATSTRPHAPIQIGTKNRLGKIIGRSFTYDANGNQVGWTHDSNGTKRTLTWDDDNHLLSVSDNGHTKTYVYDAAGQRMIKRGPQGETVYVNQYFTIRNGTVATKHVYAGTTRFASKLVKDIAATTTGKQPLEKDLYFFHPDHLGSSSYVTDTKAELYQHLEYFPFGETWVEEATNKQRTPYHYTAKELDEETGLYYYGARYYDPRTSVWQSADPALRQYLPGSGRGSAGLPGLGGIFNSRNLGLYNYAGLNPIILKDPDGRLIWFIPLIVKAVTVVGATITAYEVGAGAYDVATGKKSAREAVKEGVTNIAIDRLTFGLGKLGKNLLPQAVKDKAQALVDRVMKSCSFTAGTLVMTKEGLKPIEQIKAGDYVLARDEKTGKQTWQKVLQHYNSLHNDAIRLTITNTESGEKESVITTAEHPFYVKEQGWTRADQLKAGNLVLTASGGYLKVGAGTWLQTERLAYNMKVDQYHTYFVGKQQVWVHNDCDNSVQGYHGTTAKNIQSIRSEGLIRPNEYGEIFLSRNRADTFQHGGDLSIGGAVSGDLTIDVSAAKSVTNVSVTGNPEAILIKTDVPLPTTVNRVIVRKPDGEGGFYYEDL